MAKPVSGSVSYDPIADRPTAQLKSGVKKLLTEDDVDAAPAPTFAVDPAWVSSGHVDNVDFTGTADVLPTGMGFFAAADAGTDVRGKLLAPTALPPTVGVDLLTKVAVAGTNGSKCRFNVNSLRPSWLLYQMPSDAVGTGPPMRFAIMKKWSVAAPTNFDLMCKFTTVHLNATSALPQSFSGKFAFLVAKDNAGVPDLTTYAAIYWELRTTLDGAGDQLAYIWGGTGNGANMPGGSQQLLGASYRHGSHAYEWFVMRKRGLNWYCFAKSSSGFEFMLGTIAFTPAWTPAWWGVGGICGDGAAFSPVFGVKHLWRYDTPRGMY